MKNTKVTTSIDPDVLKALDEYAATSGLKTANTLLAAAGIELAKAHRKGLNLWHVLGRISADDPAPAALPRPAPLTLSR